MTPTVWIVAAAFGPSAIVALMKAVDMFSGQKTNLSGAGVTLSAIGIGTMDLSFLPDGVPEALIFGFGISTMISNTVLTNRSK